MRQILWAAALAALCSIFFLPCVQAGKRSCAVAVQQVAVQQAFTVSPFVVPVAVPVAAAQVQGFSYGFSSASTYAQAVRPAATATSSEDALVERIAAKVAAKLAGSGATPGSAPKAFSAEPAASLVTANCAKCHNATKSLGRFRVDEPLTEAMKLKAISRVLADKDSERMPKGKTLDAVTLGKLIQELSGGDPPALDPSPE